MDLETRQIQTTIDFRSNEDEKTPTIEGYALMFNKRSDILGGYVNFRETIDPHALDDADMSNVVATFNHDQNQVLGRSGVNMELEVDNIGLKFKVRPTDTTYARDLMENIKQGVINQCSFAFTTAQTDNAEEWSESDERGVDYERVIRSIDHLYDVSVVTTPAYPDTIANIGERSKSLIPKKHSVMEEEKRKLLFDLEKKTLLEEL